VTKINVLKFCVLASLSLVSATYIQFVHAESPASSELSCSKSSFGAGEAEFTGLPNFFEQYRLDVNIANSLQSKVSSNSCLIDYDEVKGLRKVVIVDVRNSKEYEEGHIPGSINIAEHLLKTKVFLKEKPVVLVGRGSRYTELLGLCESLPKLGFKAVYVLGEGYSAWEKNQFALGSLESPVGGLRNVKSISAKDFYSIKQKNKWLVLLLSELENIEEYGVFNVDFSKENEVIKNDISLQVEQLYVKNGVPPNILIVDQDGTNYEKLVSVIPQNVIFSSFLLEGGVDAYESFVETNKTMLVQKHRSLAAKEHGCI
jgi:rhodanese-related sulfurtransferase